MKDLFFLYVRISLEASVLIGIILVLRVALKKIPRVFIYGFWLVAMLRLLCPVHIEADLPNVSQWESGATQAIVSGLWQAEGFIDDGTGDPAPGNPPRPADQP